MEAREIFMEIFIGRQPIFNLHEQIVAYELLYRNKDSNSFPMIDSDAATVNVLINSFINIGIDELTKGHPCYRNFRRCANYGKISFTHPGFKK